ncbi:MAG TPA: adenylate/guanylate cyclase domain-containing protein [Acidimicrobiia bacterium]|nr:adenylate/guanylate cyclase domain-containing protein [Acidimicrobiia bacterium]
MTERGPLERFVPRVAAEWDLDTPGASYRQIDGTLCFVDISGFTNLSEKLARRGRIGAEELTDVLDRVFGEMLRLAYDRGGNLLKFGGDALLLMFEGSDHAVQAACAAVEMRSALRQATRIPTSVGRINLRMSVGVHSGPIDLYLVGGSHRELVITGETATITTEMEGAADAGEILVSPRLAATLGESAAGDVKGPGRLLRWRTAPAEPVGVLHRRPVDRTELAARVPTVLRAHLSHGAAEPEHRVATVGFLKFKGVAALRDTGGPDSVASALDELIRAVQAATDEEQVTFLATDIDADGGKIILTTGAPVTQVDDEGRMLRTVRAVLDRPHGFPLRIGVNRGHTYAGEIGTDFRSTYTVMGDTVNLAARLMAAAPADQIYVSAGVLERSRTLFETETLEPFMVKGKSEPVQAYRVGAETGTRTERIDASLPFRGRDAEVDLIRSAVARLADGGSARVTVVGETGMGKTRLVEESLRDHDALFRIQGEANGTANPYWALRDPLRALLGIERRSQEEMAARLGEVVTELDPSLLPLLPLLGDVTHIDLEDTEETRAIEARFRPDRTAAVLAELLAAVIPGNLVVVAEDRHWLDEATITVLDKLPSGERPTLLLYTTRPPVDVEGTVVELGPLDPTASREIAVAATEATPLRSHELETVVTRAGGNPLFLEELLTRVRASGSAESLPDSLNAVVSAEIDTLPPLARRLLRYSSVLGRSFRRVVLDELLAPEDMVIDNATRQALAHFVVAEGTERWRFRHAVMHDAAYEGLSFRKRKELHARAGEVIERLAGADTAAVAEFLALHYAIAGGHAAAWKYGVIAGDKAKRAFANVEASRHYERALESGRRLRGRDSEEVVAVLRSLASVREQAGMFAESLKALRTARTLAADQPVLLADLHLDVARSQLRTGNYTAVLRETARGMRRVEHLATPEAQRARAQLVSMRAWARLQQGKPRTALQLAERAVVEAEESGETDSLARAYTVLDNAHEMLGRPDLAVHEPQALAIYERANDLLGVAAVANNLGVRAYAMGKWGEAVTNYARACEAFRQVGNQAQAALAGANLGEVLVSLGRLSEAVEVLNDSRRVLRAHDLGDFAIFADAQLARVDIESGNPDDAAATLTRLAEEAFEIGHTGIALDATVHLAQALLSAGRAEEAVEAIDAGEHLGGGDAVYFEVPLARLKALALARLGDLGEATRLIDLAVTGAREQQLPYEEALALRTRDEIRRLAGLESDRGDLEEAERLLQVLTAGVAAT